MISRGDLRNKLDDLWLMEPSTVFRKTLVSLNDSWDSDQWAKKRFLVSHSYRFIYCYIPKIASTSLIRLMLESSNSWRRERLLNKEDNLLVRRYVLLNF
ncbi:MAG: sulfotransferase family 2 domain-containing protein, partial [Cyanobacteria bacterium J06649_11]